MLARHASLYAHARRCRAASRAPSLPRSACPSSASSRPTQSGSSCSATRRATCTHHAQATHARRPCACHAHAMHMPRLCACTITRHQLPFPGLLARARRHRPVRVPTLRRLLQVSKHTHRKYSCKGQVKAYLLCILYCRLDTNLLSRGKPAVLKLATAAFGANASWVTIATALQIQVRSTGYSLHPVCTCDQSGAPLPLHLPQASLLA